MIHVRSLNDLSLKSTWLTVGVFDGVHRGHQQIIQKLTAGARQDSAPAVVLTFWPHPEAVLRAGQVKCLAMPDERAELLSAMGVDVTITQLFDRRVASTTAHDFVAELKRHLDFRHLLIGYDFALGREREGNAARLAKLGRELDYSLEVVAALGDESGVISSTEIRKLVATGDVSEAAKLLGHNYSLHGQVVHGEGRGRELGFPTSNIAYSAEKILPANGIYACWAWLGAARHRAAVNVGVRPQFHSDAGPPLVEAHILDFEREVYGMDVRLEFVARLRDETKFASVAALVEQMGRDVGRTRQLLSLE